MPHLRMVPACLLVAVGICLSGLFGIGLSGCGPNSSGAGLQSKDAPAPAAVSEKTDSPEIAAKGEDAPAPVPAEEPSGPVQECTFDDIKFDMVKGDPFLRSMLTPKIEALEGKRIRIRGYILPSMYQTGLTEFVLVRDNMECCFGPGAALYDCVLVTMKPGKSTNYTIRPVAVDGVFSVSEFLGPDGKHLAIYHLDGEAVE